MATTRVTDAKLLHWTAGLSIVASLVHGLLVEEHFAEKWAYGVFFMLAATAQGLYGFAILASHVMNAGPISARWPATALRAFLAAGIAGNVLLIAMYVLSRTVGFFGKFEAWSPLGVFTKVVELAIVVVLTVLYARVARADRLDAEPSSS